MLLNGVRKNFIDLCNIDSFQIKTDHFGNDLLKKSETAGRKMCIIR